MRLRGAWLAPTVRYHVPFRPCPYPLTSERHRARLLAGWKRGERALGRKPRLTLPGLPPTCVSTPARPPTVSPSEPHHRGQSPPAESGHRGLQGWVRRPAGRGGPGTGVTGGRRLTHFQAAVYPLHACASPSRATSFTAICLTELTQHVFRGHVLVLGCPGPAGFRLRAESACFCRPVPYREPDDP